MTSKCTVRASRSFARSGGYRAQPGARAAQRFAACCDMARQECFSLSNAVNHVANNWQGVAQKANFVSERLSGVASDAQAVTHDACKNGTKLRFIVPFVGDVSDKSFQQAEATKPAVSRLPVEAVCASFVS